MLRRIALWVVGLSFALIMAGCASASPQPQTQPPSPAPPAAKATAQPQPAALSQPTSQLAPKLTPGSVTVFAAASLTESFTELGTQFEAANPGVKVVFNFAGSQQLRAQLEQGAGADVFASANTKEMDALIGSGSIVTGTQKTFARNRLIVIFPKDNPGKLSTVADLAKAGLKLDVADKSVPVGQYTLDMLDKMSKDPAYGADFKDKVLKNVVSYENDVKSVVSKVSLGEPDAGVVYSTDVTASIAPKIGSLQVPDKFNTLATYPIAPLAKAINPDLAKKFVALVLSDDGQRLMAKYGFLAPQTAAPTPVAEAATGRCAHRGASRICL